MNDNDLRNLSADDEYVRLLTEAYPRPKRDIRRAVMVQIAAEDTKILKNRKTGRWSAGTRDRFVRYGSLAACLVLLTVLGFRVLPMMKDVVMQEAADTAVEVEVNTSEARMTADAPTEMMTEAPAATVTEGGTANAFKVQTFSGEPVDEEEVVMVAEEADEVSYADVVTEEAPVEAAPMAPVEEVPIPEEIPVEEEAPVKEAVLAEVPAGSALEELNLPPAGEIFVEEAVVEEAVEAEGDMVDYGADIQYSYRNDVGTDSVASGTATVPKSLSYTAEGCLHREVFGNSFHDIPQSVVNLVTSVTETSDVAVWCSENAGSCNMNIYEMLTAFDVPRDAFEELYTSTDLWYHHDYNVDLLYGGDSAAVYAYYRNGGDTAFARRYFTYELKLALYTEAGTKSYSTWAGERGYTAFVQWSLAEFVRDFGISRERFTELYDATTARFTEHYPADCVPGYDLTVLYTADVDTDVPGYIADAAYTYILE